MAILPIGDLGLGNEFYDDNQASSLGRISGPLLKANLERNGIDLAFETDLLYFDATNQRIGINRDNPQYDLDVNDEIKSIRVTVSDEAIIDNVLIRSPDRIGTLQGNLDLFATGVDTVFDHDRMITTDLIFDDNIITSELNADIVLDPNGSGTVNIPTNTFIVGNLAVTGNITLSENLSAADNIIVGNEAIDTVSLSADFVRDLVPARNNIHSLGTSALRWNETSLDDIKNTDTARIANILLTSPTGFSTTTGNLAIEISGSNPVAIFERIETTNLTFDDNTVGSKSNSNIIFNPNGAGTIDLESNTYITGDLYATGNINLAGDLSSAGIITIGDQPIDRVTVNINFTQSLIPGENNQYNIGSNSNRWRSLYSDGYATITNINPLRVLVDNQLLVDGTVNKISATQTNQDVVIIPDTGITYIEQTKWQANEITNMLNTPLTLISTGIGYYNFLGTNAVVVPSGTTAEQRSNPEVGETRWNTDEGYLECWDGTVWNLSIGPTGETDVTVELVEERNYIWNLILG